MDPPDPAALKAFEQARHSWDRGDLAEAQDLYQKALDAGLNKARSYLGLVTRELGDQSGALEILREGDRRGEGWCTQYLGQMLRDAGDMEAAESAFHRAVEREVFPAAQALGLLAHQRGRKDEAESWFLRMGELAYRQGRVEPWWLERPLEAMTEEERHAARSKYDAWQEEWLARWDWYDEHGTDFVDGYALMAEREHVLAIGDVWRRFYQQTAEALDAEAAVARTDARIAMDAADAVLIKAGIDPKEWHDHEARLANAEQTAVATEPYTYLGGLPELPDRMKGRSIVILPGLSIQLQDKFGLDHARLDWQRVRSLSVDGPDEVRRRVTATRILGMGIFAWSAKKKEPESYLIIETADGEGIFTLRTSLYELRAKLAPAIAQLAARSQPSPNSAYSAPATAAEPDVLDQIQKLGQLHDAGVLTQEEFDAKKAALLDRL